MTKIKTAGLVAIAATAVSPAAFAQDYFARDRYESVTDRYQPDFDQEPVRVGTFLASPVLTVGVEVTDNVFAVPDTAGSDPEHDVIGIVGASSGFTSDWGRHEVGGDVGVSHREFFDFADESVTTLNGTVRGRLDVSRDFTIDGNVFGVSSADPRTSEAVRAAFAEPVEFDRFGGTIQANYIRDRIRLQGFANVQTVEFDDAKIRPAFADVVDGDQGFRSNTLSRVGGQVAYAVLPDVAVYAEAEVNQRDYDELTPLAGGTILADRDSDGYRLEVGADFELPNLLRGDVAVGYLEETRDDPSFVDFDGLSLDATLNWFPSRLTTVTFAAGRRTVDVGVVAAGAALETDGGVRVDHELRRNILLFGRAEYRNRAFDDITLDGGGTRDDDTWLAGFGATYKINKRFHLDAAYDLFDRSSNLEPVEFTRNAFTVTLRVFP
ncbi:MAG: outer membrane beta-barrel protein [Pseudomonadota bacterium]